MENFFNICKENRMTVQNCTEMGSALFGLGVGKMVTINLDSKTLDYQVQIIKQEVCCEWL